MIPGGQKAERGEVRVDLRRVMIVDEALPIRRKLGEILSRSGIQNEQLLVAHGAEEALEVFALERPDLIFTEMVGADPQAGLQMILEMLHVDPRARIILLTAEPADSPLVRQAVRYGVFAVLQKPLRQDKIRQVLSEIEAEEGGIERFK